MSKAETVGAQLTELPIIALVVGDFGPTKGHVGGATFGRLRGGGREGGSGDRVRGGVRGE